MDAKKQVLKEVAASTPVCSNALLDEGISILRRVHNIDVSCFSESFLAQTLERRREAIFAKTVSDYLVHLSESRKEAEQLLFSLRVSYSEFFRNPLSFSLLEKFVIPGLLLENETHGRTDLRIWCAGCATGQEAWSLAILMEDLLPTINGQFSYRIFASDLSETDLNIARTGVYDPDALGNIRFQQFNEYFEEDGNHFTVKSRLRAHLDFSNYDLLDEKTVCLPASIYGDFDLVLCCNVLLYYKPEIQVLILKKIGLSLVPGGYLVVSESESLIVEKVGGFRKKFDFAPIFQKC